MPSANQVGQGLAVLTKLQPRTREQEMLLRPDCWSLMPRNGSSQLRDNQEQRGKEEAVARETQEEELPSSETAPENGNRREKCYQMGPLVKASWSSTSFGMLTLKS